MSERAEKVFTGADEDVGVWTEEGTSGDWVGRGGARFGGEDWVILALAFDWTDGCDLSG